MTHKMLWFRQLKVFTDFSLSAMIVLQIQMRYVVLQYNAYFSMYMR